MRRLYGLFGVLALGAASIAAAIVFTQTPGTHVAHADAGTSLNTIAVDATSGGSVDATRTVADTNPFTIDINVTSVVDPYQAFQARVSYDTSILQWTGTPVVETFLGSAFLCGGGFVDQNDLTLYDGCARQTGTQSNTGVAFTWELECIGNGTSPLHLQTDAEIGDALGTNFGGTAAGLLGATTVDASVTCTGAGSAPTATSTATATATNTAVVPTATNTTQPTATNTTEPTATNTSVAPTATNTTEPTATNTSVAPTATNTTGPTATNTTEPTATNTSVAPTATNTTGPTATNTPEPTATNTSVAPTATNTSVAPTATNTSVAPTATNTSVAPTATNTSVAPTATNTSVAPTATPTVSPGGQCLTIGQKIRLAIGIILRFGAHANEGHGPGTHHPPYKATYDVNGDGVIDINDLTQVVTAPTCPHGHGHGNNHDD